MSDHPPYKRLTVLRFSFGDGVVDTYIDEDSIQLSVPSTVEKLMHYYRVDPLFSKIFEEEVMAVESVHDLTEEHTGGKIESEFTSSDIYGWEYLHDR